MASDHDHYSITLRGRHPQSVRRDFVAEPRWSPAVKRRVENREDGVIIRVEHRTYGLDGPKRAAVPIEFPRPAA